MQRGTHPICGYCRQLLISSTCVGFFGLEKPFKFNLKISNEKSSKADLHKPIWLTIILVGHIQRNIPKFIKIRLILQVNQVLMAIFLYIKKGYLREKDSQKKL